MRLLLLIAVPLILYFVIQAKAQDQMTMSGSPSARFTLQPSGDQFLRMDTQTGEMSVCQRRLEKWVCEEVADTAKAKDEEIARLTKENERLRARVATLQGDTPKNDADGKIELPTKEDLDKVMGFFEDVMKRFNEMVKRLDKQTQPETEKQKI